MAGTTVTINFDAGIDKVYYSYESTFGNSSIIANSGDTVLNSGDIYFRPSLKSGYEINSVIGATLSDSANGTYHIQSLSTTVVTFTSKQSTPKVTVDLTSLSGYESLPAGTYALGVKAKAANYQDSDLSQTVSFTKLAAPIATAADTTVTWDAITNAESYDVYVDGELYENTTGGYDITTTVTNGTYSGDTTITDTATITIAADSGYKLPDTVTVTGASQTWNKETGTLTLTNPTGAVTVSAVCESAVTYFTISFSWPDTVYVNGTQVSSGVGGSYNKIKAGDTIRVTCSSGYISTSFPNKPSKLVNGTYTFPAQDIEISGIYNEDISSATDVTFILT